jgi:site-specific DNA recombinase
MIVVAESRIRLGSFDIWPQTTREASTIRVTKNSGSNLQGRLAEWKHGKNSSACTTNKDNQMASPKLKPVTAPRAVLYARFSSDMQKDRSIDDQFVVCQTYARRERLDVIGKYFDKAKSGASMLDRTGLRDLIAAARRKEFDVLVVEATDRLSRNQADLPWIFEHLEYNGVKIFTPSNGEVTRMQVAFDGISNPGYSKKLAERVKRGHDGVAREGLIPGRRAYGYDLVEHQTGVKEINTDQANIVIRVFEEYASGKSPRKIAADLMRDKIPSPSGSKHWNSQCIVGGSKKRGLIRNQLYVGVYLKNRFYNIKNPETGKTIARKADADDLITVQVPHLRIISQKLWDAAHALRMARGHKKLGASGQVQRAVVSRKQRLLSGLLRCGECNGRMVVRSGQRVSCSAAHNNQSCKHGKHYELAKLIALAVDSMCSHLTDPEFIKEKARARTIEFARLEKENSGARQAAVKQFDRLDVQISRLVAAISDSDQPVKELMASIKAKEIERVALAERIRLLGAASNVTALHPNVIKAFGKNIETLHAKLKRNADDPECRMAFGNIVDCVVVHPTNRGAPYEISVYARISAIIGGVDLFPAQRSHKEIVAAEGLPRVATDGLVGNKPLELSDQSFSHDAKPPWCQRSLRASNRVSNRQEMPRQSPGNREHP